MKLLNWFVLFVVLACGVGAVIFLVNSANFGYAISTTYHYSGEQKGIVTVPPVNVEYPTIPYIQLLSTRFPAFVLLDSVGFYDLGKCKSDLIWKAHISNPTDRFLCYNTPLGQYTQERPIDPWGRGMFKGNVFCYARTTGSEGQGIDSEAAVREKILTVLVNNPEKESSWTELKAINSDGIVIDMPVCA